VSETVALPVERHKQIAPQMNLTGFEENAMSNG